MANFKWLYQAVLIQLCFLFSAQLFGQCPEIKIIDLRNVPGYAQFNEMSICGSADTLSAIIYSGDPGTVLGFELELNLPQGLQYDGWEYAEFGGTSISVSDTDPSNPKFIIDGFGGDSLIVANIGVSSNCNVDISEELFIDFDYQFRFIDTSNVMHKCSGIYTPLVEYNSVVKEPVLNLLAGFSPSEVSVSSLGGEFCQKIKISQDGISSYLDSFVLEVQGLDFSTELDLVSVRANGTYNVPFDFDQSSLITSMVIKESMFLGNSLANPIDEQFNTNEIITIDLCYSVAACPVITPIPFIYNAYWGCQDEVCQMSSRSSVMEIKPIGALNPEATTNLINGPAICGESGQIEMTISNPNSLTEQNEFRELVIGYKTCQSENLFVEKVEINGIELPSETYDWIEDDLFVDLKAFPTGFDPDGPGGLEDLDGDGIYDDLPGGNSIALTIFMGLSCSVSDGDCGDFACDFSQFYVEGINNCATNFTAFPTVDGFALSYGQIAVSNPNEAPLNADSTVWGYNFGKYSNDGAPLASIGSKQVEIEFCYDFAIENIEECTITPDTKLEVHFSGDPRYAEDIEFVPGSASFSNDGGTNYVPVSDALVDVNLIDESNVILTINEGTTDPQLCYKYSIELDSCHCTPAQFFGANQRVVSVCDDCDPVCEMVKGCRPTLFRVDPECSPCICPAQYIHERSTRSNFGYIDKQMSRRLTRDEVPSEDLARFMPGDTLEHWGTIEILTEDILVNQSYWSLNWYYYPIGGSYSTADKLELSMDASASILDKIEVENPDGTTHVVDISDLASCAMGGTSAAYGSFIGNFNQHDWLNHTGDYRTCGAFKNSHDGFDNNFLNFYLTNYESIQECNGLDPSKGTYAPYGEGNCLDEFISTYGIVVNSKIKVKFRVPLIKNPYRAQAEILGTAPTPEPARIYPAIAFYSLDNIAGNSTFCGSHVGSACIEYEPIFGSCPGNLKSRTDIVLDNCGGTVTHSFSVQDFAGPPGDEWFTAEYRPLLEINDVTAPIYSPLAYCGNAKVMQNGIETEILVDSTINMICNPVSSVTDDVCAVENGSIGHINFNLFEQGIAGLGIGLDNCDTIKITYDYCMVCPASISDLQNYELMTDWCTVKHRPDECSTKSMICTHYDAGTIGTSLCDDLNIPHGANYFDALSLDTLYCKNDQIGAIGEIDDSEVTPFLPIETTNEGSNLIVSGSPGVSEEIQPVQFCNPNTTDLNGVTVYVEVPSSVRFENIYSDLAGTNPYVSNLVSDNGSIKRYAITLTSNVLPGGECTDIYVGTTLLFCPIPGALPAEICVGASSGCAPLEIMAAIGGSGSCSSSEICYIYVSGEVGIQTEWFDPPTNIDLCGSYYFNMRIKNVKELVLLGLDVNFELPAGVTIDPNSWEVAYPGGPTSPLNWTSVPAPDVVSGNSIAYSSDAIWSAPIGADIHLNGLEGVSLANATEDKNKVAFRFKASTDCDSFLSGSKLKTETSASDPCSDDLVSTGVVESQGVVINDADPAENAQLLIIADPRALNCQASINTFGVVAINTSEYPTADSVITCINIPSNLTYVQNSLTVTQPQGFVIGSIDQTTIGNELQLCFGTPLIGVSQSMKLTFDAAVDLDAACGTVEIDVDIKSVIESAACVPGPPEFCDVFVQNSLNPTVSLLIKPPFIAEDWNLYSECASGEDVSLFYTFNINHNGPNALNQDYTANFYKDVDGDLMINPNIDNILATSSGTFSVNDGESIVINGNVIVAQEDACPIMMEVIYPTSCTCDKEEKYFDNIILNVLAEFTDPISMCPGDCLAFEVCDFVSVALDSIIGATDVEYMPGLTYSWGATYPYPHDSTQVPIKRGPVQDFILYDNFTDNLAAEPISHKGAVLLNEQSAGASDAFIYATFPVPVNVERLYLAAGRVAGWSYVPGLAAYGGRTTQFEYSLDGGVTWIDSGLNSAFPNDNVSVFEYILPNPIASSHWRFSSRGQLNWGTSEFRFEGDPLPFQGQQPVSRDGNTVTVCVFDGVGVDAPLEITFDAGLGECRNLQTLEINNIGDYEISLGDEIVACGTDCVDLEVELIGEGSLENTTVSWSPPIGLSDPFSLETEACVTADMIYTVSVTFPGGCVKTTNVSIDHQNNPPIEVDGADVECFNTKDHPILIAPAGFDQYLWFQVINGAEIPIGSSVLNTIEITEAGGEYFVKGVTEGMDCPGRSAAYQITDKLLPQICLPVNFNVNK